MSQHRLLYPERLIAAAVSPLLQQRNVRVNFTIHWHITAPIRLVEDSRILVYRKSLIGGKMLQLMTFALISWSCLRSQADSRKIIFGSRTGGGKQKFREQMTE